MELTFTTATLHKRCMTSVRRTQFLCTPASVTTWDMQTAGDKCVQDPPSVHDWHPSPLGTKFFQCCHLFHKNKEQELDKCSSVNNYGQYTRVSNIPNVHSIQPNKTEPINISPISNENTSSTFSIWKHTPKWPSADKPPVISAVGPTRCSGTSWDVSSHGTISAVTPNSCQQRIIHVGGISTITSSKPS